VRAAARWLYNRQCAKTEVCLQPIVEFHIITAGLA
jgi:hypothetical protein